MHMDLSGAGLFERRQRTLGEGIDQHEPQGYTEAKTIVDGVIDNYDRARLDSALCFLKPIDYNRVNSEVLLAERRRKLEMARQLRKQENVKL